jgi:hypothetical protein
MDIFSTLNFNIILRYEMQLLYETSYISSNDPNYIDGLRTYIKIIDEIINILHIVYKLSFIKNIDNINNLYYQYYNKIKQMV